MRLSFGNPLEEGGGGGRRKREGEGGEGGEGERGGEERADSRLFHLVMRG